MKAQNETLIKIMIQRLKDQEGVIDNLWKNLHNGIVKEIDRRNHSLELIGQGLERLSPLKTLNRGYSMAMHKNTVISSIDQVNLGDSIDIIVKNGIIKTETVSKKEGSIDDKENKNI
jgi:exodeoxyribonuclease VII large subunit